MIIFKKHTRLFLLALLMPIPMILASELEGPIARIVFMGSFFAVMAPMLIVRFKGELPMDEFMAIGGVMIGSWVLLVLLRAGIYGLLVKPI